MIRPRKARGDGTFPDAGTKETQGERKFGSVVALLMSSVDPASGVSGPVALCGSNDVDESKRKPAIKKVRINLRLRNKQFFIHPQGP
jgi:hypothetical protein